MNWGRKKVLIFLWSLMFLRKILWWWLFFPQKDIDLFGVWCFRLKNLLSAVFDFSSKRYWPFYCLVFPRKIIFWWCSIFPQKDLKVQSKVPCILVPNLDSLKYWHLSNPVLNQKVFSSFWMNEDFNPKKKCILNLFETGSIAKLVYFLNFFSAEIIKVATERRLQRPVHKTCRPGNVLLILTKNWPQHETRLTKWRSWFISLCH